MQYFQAVQKGKSIANKSQMRLFDLAGFAMLTLTTKKVDGEFLPVGEKDLVAVIETPNGHVAILVDEDGYTKAQSKAMEKEDALKIYQKAIKADIEKFTKKEVMIWNDVYPVLD